jgi:hypothetical protein
MTLLETVIKFFKSLFATTPVAEVPKPEIVKAEPVKESSPVAPGLSENPAYNKGKEFVGKTETDPLFNKYLSSKWKLVGLPKYTTIIGTSFAWCGLFIAAMNSEVGQDWISNGAGARNWGKYGQAIEWKVNGIPRGAVMHLNHNGQCASGSSNHVTFADGDCTASDLLKPGATVPGYGGNQSNTVKTSIYSIKEVCEVRWPKELKLPAKITKSVDCKQPSQSNESTR